MNERDQVNEASPPRLATAASAAADWFTQRVTEAIGSNLRNLTVYGPAVTTIFRAEQHRLHYLIVLADHNVDQLLELAKSSSEAARQRIAPPLIMSSLGLRRSYDVFPLEWIDIAQFHLTVIGAPVLEDLPFESTKVRLQCERELRSLEIQLQRGILASGGDGQHIRRLEAEAADALVRVLRGISWLAGDRTALLPAQLLQRCTQILGLPLDGCRDATRSDGRHDIASVRLLLQEIVQLSAWVDRFEKVAS